MKIRKWIRKIAMLVSAVMLLTSTVGTTYGFMVTQTESVTNVFLPAEGTLGGLTVSKSLEHPLGDSYAIPAHIRFDFTLELGAYYAGATLKTSAGDKTVDGQGVLRIQLAPGESFSVQGLEPGTQVKITELPTALSGFAVKGEQVQTVTVDGEGKAAAAFENVYTPASVTGDRITLGGVKVLEGRPWQSGDSFTFLLEQQTGESWTKLGEQTVTYDPDRADFDKFDFGSAMKSVTFDRVGTYTFRVSEVAGELEDMAYDQTVNYFTVKVTDVDMDGKLEISAVTGTENAAVTASEGGYRVDVTFNNTFKPSLQPDPQPIQVHIGVIKQVINVGTAKLGPEDFRFVLRNADTGEALAAVTDEAGRAAFRLEFTKADAGKTFTYTLGETDQGIEGMTYDPHVEEFTVKISLNAQNQLVAELTANGVAVTELMGEFVNTYDGKLPVPPTGDRAKPVLWGIVMVLSASALVALVVYDRKRK